MIKKYIDEANFEDTGFSYTLSLISGKYKMVILYCLMEFEPVRFNELRRYLKNVADKTLSQNLKELERDGLIRRKMYPEVPPKVEYTLTPRGQSLVPLLPKLLRCLRQDQGALPRLRSICSRSGKKIHKIMIHGIWPPFFVLYNV